MALKAMKAPAAAKSLLRDALAEAAGPLGGATRSLSAAPAQALEAPEPLPVFVITPEQILQGSFLKNALHQGWSYTVFRENVPIAGAELAQNANEEDLHFSHFSEGPFVEATVSAVAKAEILSQEVEYDFELRLLRFPALYLMAVWLHSETRDLFIPMGPTHHLFEANRAYEQGEFDQRLLEAAKESLALAPQVNPEPDYPNSEGQT